MKSLPVRATTLADQIIQAESSPILAQPPGRNEGAMILNLQRLSTEDGPGLRTTVFFKGCPLACAWCHNPESIAPGCQIQWMKTRCIGCGSCVSACPQNCLKLTDDGMVIDRERCSLCLKCTDACPANAMEKLGCEVGLDDLLADLLKDRIFFENSGGGVTASGGEPTLQADFVRRLFTGLKQNGIHTALDTCGLVRFETLETLLPVTDLVLYDLKDLDPERHRRFTGSSSRPIIENLLRLKDSIFKIHPHTKIWLRTPLIPGRTAAVENIAAISDFIREELAGLAERWELCAFNNLCREKYERLGLAWQFEEASLLEWKVAEELLQIARGCGLDPACVQVTGATQALYSEP